MIYENFSNHKRYMDLDMDSGKDPLDVDNIAVWSGE